MVNEYIPKTLEQALDIKKNQKVIPYMGGTDLMVNTKETDKYLFLNHIEQLKQISLKDNKILVGSGVTFAELLNSPDIPEIFYEVIRQIASPALRNVATMGGNICNSSPGGDSLLPLYIYDAKLELVSKEGSRIVPIQKFIQGVKRNVLKGDEILKTIMIPNTKFDYEYYKKVGTRKASSIAKLSFIGAVMLKGEKIKDIKIAYGVLGTTIVRDRKTELKYIDKTIEEIKGKYKSEIIQDYRRLIAPRDSKRSTAEYRERTALRLLKDFIENIG